MKSNHLGRREHGDKGPRTRVGNHACLLPAAPHDLPLPQYRARLFAHSLYATYVGETAFPTAYKKGNRFQQVT